MYATPEAEAEAVGAAEAEVAGAEAAEAAEAGAAVAAAVDHHHRRLFAMTLRSTPNRGFSLGFLPHPVSRLE